MLQSKRKDICMNRNVICIDLKSFFASAECANRNLDPFTTPLVVADTKRGNAAMTLAATPYLRSLGVASRSRVFMLPKNINIIFAPPRMKLYESMSKQVIDIYKSFIDEEDIYVFSIDEAFLDITDYLKYYNMTDYELALTIMKTIYDKTKLTSTCGIGPNMFLAKVAMDIEAKHNKDFISKWTYEDIEKKLQLIEPLDKICGIGSSYKKHLNNLGIYKLKDIFKYNRDFYIKRFGKVAGNDIWLKANGIDFSTVKEKNKEEKEKSISMSQILLRDYNKDEAFLIIKEMTDMLTRKLRSIKKQTTIVSLSLKYSRDLYKGFHDTIKTEATDNTEKILEIFKYTYDSNIEDLPIRKISIHFSKFQDKKYKQLSLFDKNNNEEKYIDMLDKIYTKKGPITLLRASSLLESSTIKNREKFKNMID